MIRAARCSATSSGNATTTAHRRRSHRSPAKSSNRPAKPPLMPADRTVVYLDDYRRAQRVQHLETQMCLPLPAAEPFVQCPLCGTVELGRARLVHHLIEEH